jgi:hypothetical protein
VFAAAGENRGRIVAMVRYLLELRVRDESAFDLLCLKILNPDLTHAQLAEIMREGERVQWAEGSGRVRSYERFKRLAERFPELADVVSFDRRGGDQSRGTVHPADLDREYRYLVDRERRKPRGKRRKAKGKGGLYHEVARTCGVKGRNGKPSWQAAEQRIVRWRREAKKRAE